MSIAIHIAITPQFKGASGGNGSGPATPTHFAIAQGAGSAKVYTAPIPDAVSTIGSWTQQGTPTAFKEPTALGVNPSGDSLYFGNATVTTGVWKAAVAGMTSQGQLVNRSIRTKCIYSRRDVDNESFVVMRTGIGSGDYDIVRVDGDGNVTNVLDATSNFYALAYDEVNDWLYYTNALEGRRVRRDGTGDMQFRATVKAFAHQGNGDVDPAAGYVFWPDGGSVWRYTLTGAIQFEVTTDNAMCLCVVRATQKLFYAAGSSLFEIGYDGSGKRDIGSLPGGATSADAIVPFTLPS